jgi:hypothetical protein
MESKTLETQDRRRLRQPLRVPYRRLSVRQSCPPSTVFFEPNQPPVVATVATVNAERGHVFSAGETLALNGAAACVQGPVAMAVFPGIV